MPDSGAASAEDLKPIVPYLSRDAEGRPALVGCKCYGCGETSLGTLRVCPACGLREAMVSRVLSNTGRLYNWTTVHRSLPGVPTPFVFAIVDLDLGGVVKGNLKAPAEDITFDMPVRVVFEQADQLDAKGRAYLTYHFVPA